MRNALVRSKSMTMLFTSAALVTAVGFAGPSASADTVNPQPTVVGCAVQGTACPADASPAEQGAVSWAQSQLGSDGYYELCQAFVYDAYLDGAGVDIGGAESAVDYWNAHPEWQHPGDTNPPVGALVYWDATPTNDAGHVGIAEGGDTVISSYEESTSTVHEFSLAARNGAGYPYLGWMLPGV